MNIKSLENPRPEHGAMTARRILDLNTIRRSHETFKDGLDADQREVKQRRTRSVLPVGRGDVKERGRHTDALVE
jgi:hypothetical protein